MRAQHDDGRMQVSIRHAALGLDLRVCGHRWEADLNGDTDMDWTPAVDMELQGAVGEVANFTEGDHISLHVVHPVNGIIATYGDAVYVKPSGGFRVVADSAAKIPNGLILRAVYHSVATVGDAPIVYVDYWTWR